METLPFNREFCEFLEYHLSDTFAHSTDPIICRFWCDGVNDELPLKTKKHINDTRTLETIAWIGIDGNSKYILTIHFGNKSLSRYARNLSLQPCVPSSESMDWIEIDPNAQTIALYLK